jgi:hypothetical protein
LKKCLNVHPFSTIISCDEKVQICTKNDAFKGLTARALRALFVISTQDSSREYKAKKTRRLTVYSKKQPPRGKQQICRCQRHV